MVEKMKTLFIGPYPTALEEQLRKKNYILESNSQNAVNIIKEYSFDIIVTGLHIGNPNGFAILSYIQKYNPQAVSIVTSGDEKPESRSKCEKLGAKRLIREPFDLEELELIILKLIEERKEVGHPGDERNRVIQEEIDNVFVGEGAIVNRLKKEILQIAPTKINVLITGESGTGKDITARLIHMYSSQQNTFICLNCGSLPESLVESELFGYEKGAFTGAYSQKKGLFEQAEGGTLFLDEIGELSSSAQASVLKVIEEKIIRRIGGNRNIPIDVRLIAATNIDLADAVKNKKFREDLYYRINIINIYIPPLRMRITDIPVIARHLLKKLNQELSRNIKGFTDQVLTRFMEYPWPGNVRELRNIIERAVIFCKGDYMDELDIELSFNAGTISEKTIPEGTVKPSNYKENPAAGFSVADGGLNEAVDDFERSIIGEALKKCDYNKTRTAEYLKLKRTTLLEKIKRLQIS